MPKIFHIEPSLWFRRRVTPGYRVECDHGYVIATKDMQWIAYPKVYHPEHINLSDREKPRRRVKIVDEGLEWIEAYAAGRVEKRTVVDGTPAYWVIV